MKTLYIASKAELAHNLKSRSVALIVSWLTSSVSAWSTWACRYVRGLLTLEGKLRISWVQWAFHVPLPSARSCDEDATASVLQWIIQNQAWYLETSGYCRLLSYVPWYGLSLHSYTGLNLQMLSSPLIAFFCFVSRCHSFKIWSTVTTFLLEVISVWLLVW